MRRKNSYKKAAPWPKIQGSLRRLSKKDRDRSEAEVNGNAKGCRKNRSPLSLTLREAYTAYYDTTI